MSFVVLIRMAVPTETVGCWRTGELGRRDFPPDRFDVVRPPLFLGMVLDKVPHSFFGEALAALEGEAFLHVAGTRLVPEEIVNVVSPRPLNLEVYRP
jgi:hypothetical protein